MKVGLLVALLTSILVSAAGAATVTMAPPPAQNKMPEKAQQPKVLPVPAKPSLPAQAKTQAAAKADPCDCPKERKARRAASHAPHARGSHRAMARSYRYAAAAPWHGPWHGAPQMGPPPGYEVEGLRIDDFGWTGGVGYAPDGGGGGGYGQAYFANGGSIENGPTYNSTGQSFQYNPSQAGPFQPRLMGGFAPPSR